MKKFSDAAIGAWNAQLIRDYAKPEMSYGDVIERIVELAMEHPIHERTAQ